MSNRHYSVKQGNSEQISSRLISISASKDDGDWKSVPHAHHFTELFFVTKGQGFFEADEDILEIEKGDLIIIPPYTEHTERSRNHIPLEYYVLGVEGISFLEEENVGGVIFCSFRDDSSIQNLFSMMLDEIKSSGYGSDAICQHMLEILILKIIRLNHITPIALASVRMTKECAQIKEYMDSNYSEHITLDKLTELTHMNKYYIAHSFRKYTGLSPIQYLNQRRLDTACRLLEETDYSVCDIAAMTGFSSQSYFTQIFRKFIKTTPIRYRVEHSDKKDRQRQDK